MFRNPLCPNVTDSAASRKKYYSCLRITSIVPRVPCHNVAQNPILITRALTLDALYLEPLTQNPEPRASVGQDGEELQHH